ncbi:MAG: N4-gp56 family major capsid protein [Rhodoferax sp.]|nr:N4-gp56 family major capsid protein [Rhodoferax sp.]
MARTLVGVNDAQAVKKWSGLLSVASTKASYFSSKMMGEGKRAKRPIQRIDDLTSDAGDTVTVDLLMPMKMDPVIGADTLDGKEESLRYYTDRVLIDQVRGGADLGDRMTRKRTLRSLREDALAAMKQWWARAFDELFFIYLSGSRGTGGGYIWSAANPFFNVNALTAPDTMHQMYASTATSAATITNAMGMDLRLIDRAVARAETMGGDTTDELSMVPCDIDGEDKFVCLMHTFQFDSLKSSATTGQWLDIQKAAAAAQGAKNPIFTGALGEYNGVILHKHRNVIQFGNYGAGANLPAARALFMGSQAAMIAFGSPGTGLRFDWTEEVKDHGDKVKIGSNSIFGVKKATYKSNDNSVVRDFGVIALDTYAVNPQ